MLPVRRLHVIRPRLGGVDSRLLRFARGTAIGVVIAVVGVACSSSSSKPSSSVALTTTTGSEPVPSTGASDQQVAASLMVDAAKFGTSWTGRTMTAREVQDADVALRTACPAIARALQAMPATRSRAAYRYGPMFPQIVIDRRILTSTAGSDSTKAFTNAVDTMRSGALQACLLTRASGQPVGLRDTSITRLEFDGNANAFGYRVRGFSGAATSTVLVLNETVVVASADTISIATISSSGRFPTAVTLPTTVANALNGK